MEVDNWILRETVRLEGRTVRGKSACLTISPTRKKSGWVWNVGGHQISITPDIMFAKEKRVALVSSGHILNEFEHIGVLRAAGLHDVEISCSGPWPPFDGGSFALWQAVMPHVYKEGVLKPYTLSKSAGGSTSTDPERYADYWVNNSPTLTIEVQIDYKHLGKKEHFHIYPKDDLLDLVRARTLGHPAWLEGIARHAEGTLKPAFKLFGRAWPHYSRVLWRYHTSPELALSEIARHRALDALAVLNFLAPRGTYLTGHFRSVLGNHATDISLMRNLRIERDNVVSLRRAA